MQFHRHRQRRHTISDPTITKVSPSLVGVNGGTLIRIEGQNFTSDDEVLIDEQPLANQVFVSLNEIDGETPALPVGSHELQIRRCGNIVARLAGACQSGGLPRIFFLTPRQAFARGGNYVTVSGINFLPTTKIRIGFRATDGSNLLVNALVSDDGTTITGQIPTLPANELLGRDVFAEDERGQDVLPAGVCYLPNPVETDPQVVSLRALEAATQEPLDVRFRNGFPTGIGMRVKIEAADSTQRARSFVRSFRELLRQKDPDTDLSVLRVSEDGPSHVALSQQYGGVPVYGGEIVVTTVGDEVWALTGSLLPTDVLDARNLNLTPTLGR